MAHDAFSEYFRAPAARAHFVADADASPPPGYFRVGSATCFGRCAAVDLNASTRSLHDAKPQIRIDGSSIRLPFDPDEVVNNLRIERYVDVNRRSSRGFLPLLKSVYYGVRPFLPARVRKYVQQLWAAGGKKSSFPDWPVDCTVDVIMQVLLELASRDSAGIPFIWFWPEGHSNAVIMTHDVETAAGRDFCPELMTLDDSFGVKSSFNLVPEKRYSIPAELVREITTRGFEVGIHDLNHDGRLFESRSLFEERVRKINHYGQKYGAKGFRSAVLYRNPDWFAALNFVYDSSFPNVARFDPQRGGCCTVMPFFIGEIVELPITTVQDYTLFHVLHENSIQTWISQMEIGIRQHGLISFLAHPDYLIEQSARDRYRQLLERVTGRLQEVNAWLALPAEVAAWWKQRSRMELKRRQGKWYIEGEGSDKARIAYATLDSGSFNYEVCSPIRRGAST